MPHRTRVELQFDPVHDATAVATGSGDSVYTSTGADPQFLVRPANGIEAITPGWWRLTGELSVLDGAIIAPRFYPDHGAGFDEGSCLPAVACDGVGPIDSILFVPQPIRTLRFDPTERQATFRLQGVAFEPVSRPAAVVRMLLGIARGTNGGPRRAWRAGVALLRDCISASPSRAARALLEAYVESARLKSGSYDLWHRLYDPLHFELVEQAEAATQFDEPSCIDLLLHADAPALEALTSCIDSVLAQTWHRWRLEVIVSRPSARARDLLRARAEADPRITYAVVEDAASISGQPALPPDAAWIGVLDVEVRLAPAALCEVALALRAFPDTGLLYADSDRIDMRGQRMDPCFRPAWNEVLARASCFTGPFLVIARDVWARIPGQVLGPGSSRHGLLLRCADAAGRPRIRHIARVLYHVAGTDAESDAGAVSEHLRRRGLEATVAQTPRRALRVTPMRRGTPPVTIIVPTRDRLALLRTCVESVLERTLYPVFEMVVVDNGSVEPDTLAYLDSLRGRERCRVLPYAAPFNFSAITNAGVHATTGEVVCLLNNDIEVISPHWLDELVAHATLDGIGAVGAMLYYPDDTIQHGGVVIGIGGVAGHVHHRAPRGTVGYHGRAAAAQELSAVTAACLAVRRSVFEEVGGFDESLAVAFNDIDFCLRVLDAGYRNVWTPHAELYHHESASRGQEDTAEKRARFAAEVERMRRRWRGRLEEDPAYNPNLTLDWSNFELAFPPRVPRPRSAVAFARSDEFARPGRSLAARGPAA